MKSVDSVMFAVAFVLLIIVGYMYGDAKSELQREVATNAALTERIETQTRWIRSLQGRLNARRADLGMDEIEFTKY